MVENNSRGQVLEHRAQVQIDSGYQVRKINGRLWIVDPEDMPIYTPPEFLRPHIVNREQLNAVAERFNQRGRYDIDAVREFETSVRKLSDTV